MKRILREELGARGLYLADFKLKGHPERWFDPNDDYSADRIVLAGDAAGAEPWLGEGISHAQNFGMVAADVAIDGFARNDFSFSSYRQVVSRSGLGRRLRLKRLIAHYFYGNGSRWQYRIGSRIADIAFRFV